MKGNAEVNGALQAHKSTFVDEDSAPGTSPVIDPHLGRVAWTAAGNAAELLAPPMRAGDLGSLAGYRVLAQLGAGGMGAVFKAIDPRLERPVALKVMKPMVAQASGAQVRFLREARALASVQSDHVVGVFEVGEAGGLPFLAMELLEGQTLQQWLERGGRPSLPEILRLAREIGIGLSAAHDRALIHRDIKPANLWLQAPIGRVKLLDFGLVRAQGGEAPLTQEGCVVGTPHYMSPEQAVGAALDARSDLFSLGCVLYRLCTGRIAFDGASTLAVLNSLATLQPPTVRELNPAIPEELSTLVMQMLAKRREERPGSAFDVVERIYALEQKYLASQSGILRYGSPPPTPLPPPLAVVAPAAAGLDPRWCWLVGWIVLLNATTLLLALKLGPAHPPPPPPHLLPHAMRGQLDRTAAPPVARGEAAPAAAD